MGKLFLYDCIRRSLVNDVIVADIVDPKRHIISALTLLVCQQDLVTDIAVTDVN